NSIVEQPKIALLEASGQRSFIVEDDYRYLYEINVCNDACLRGRLRLRTRRAYCPHGHAKKKRKNRTSHRHSPRNFLLCRNLYPSSPVLSTRQDETQAKGRLR